MHKFHRYIVLLLIGVCGTAIPAFAQNPNSFFDDKQLLDGFSEKIANESLDILLAMIQDDSISPYKIAAAVRVFRQEYAKEIFSQQKIMAEKILWKRLNKTDSRFIEVEIMHTLCLLDRYKYFKTLVPNLIKKLDHYNDTVNELAYNSINDIINTGPHRPREARIVF